MRVMKGFWALFIFSAGTVAAIGGPAGLPAGVLARLEEEYPGWKVAVSSKAVWEEFRKEKRPDHPNLLSADFDKDGKRDWVVHVSLVVPGQEEQFVTVFLERDAGYEEAIIESRGLDPNVYVTQRSRSVTEHVSGKNQISQRTELVIIGGPMGDSAYYWENGQFRESPSDTTDIQPMENFQ